MRGEGLDAAATALGVTDDELHTALESGKSIADVAKDKGVSVDKVIDAMVKDATTHIDQAVTDGKLTSDQAAQIKADLKTRITAMVNGERPAGGPGGFGHRGFRGGPGASTEAPGTSGTY